MTGRMARRWDHLRTSRIVLTGLWADAVLVMAASAWNGGLAFEALGQHIGEGIALGVAVDVGLAVSLIGDRALHLHGKSSHWGRALRIVTAVMSLCLNCGVSIWLGHYGVALFHAFLPILLVLLSEYAQDTTLKFGEIADEHEAAVKAERDAQLKEDREKWEAEHPAASRSREPVAIGHFTVDREVPEPIPAAVPPRFQTAPLARPDFIPAVGSAPRPDSAGAGRPAGRPDDQPADRPAEQPAAGGNGAKTGRRGRPPRGATRRAKPDEQLVPAVRELAERNGGAPPTQYAVRQALGVGGPRAARLIEELAATAGPAAPPSTNGATARPATRDPQ